MNLPKNHFGVPQYPRDDARRLFVLLSAIDLLERPTLSALTDLTGYDKDAIEADVAILREQFGVLLHKVGDMYHIASWGDVLRKNGVKRHLKP